ncbi:class I SAM-dependent methyltransferase [Pseudovibrio brasiliensis]|uniref:S-adenosyl-L-methionine-dependent methyltransferase n=1 Tax=Pseudovibrio brasiliensis TaxID=1898042 RepID=A0ABX8AUD3_9HYPH|nr:class I SAM-dependent methyltransferase [Pseudovibrio brasiliensis]QUS58687.1 class I SAM-dependent methyltransferase [Pseudovibrio brasiliensis]
MKEKVASSTAYTVLQGLMLTGEKPEYRHLVTAKTLETGKTILEGSHEGRRRLKQLNSRLFRALVPLMEWLILPGISTHYGLRKKYIRDAVENAISQGYTMVVNLGAGFDTLAYELHSQFSEVTFFELDHPATSAHKQSALDGQISDNFHLIKVDFKKTSAKEALVSHEAYDATMPAVFICEGVLMYLPVSDVKALFSGLAELGETTRIVFSSVTSFSDPKNNCGPLLNLYLRIKGEPLSWTFPLKDVASFIKEQGYVLLDVAEAGSLKDRYLPNITPTMLHRGEYLVQAQVSSTCDEVEASCPFE